MIIHLKPGLTPQQVEVLAQTAKAQYFFEDGKAILIRGAAVKQLPAVLDNFATQHWVLPNDMQLASKAYISEKRTVKIGDISIGGDTKNTILIGGPCSVESDDQIESSSALLLKLGLKTLRGGCYKPRTSPYSFQGMGLQGLELLVKMREEHGLTVVTEVRDASQIDEVIQHADVIQVGAKAMYDQGILRACGKTKKPILIKRGFGSTLQEFVQAAEFVLSGGNPNVVLCERGIRTFETGTRFTLDLCGVAWLKEHCNLPIILDPSHAMGYAYGVADLAKACVAMGIDGLLIETHPDPAVALSDASQQLNHEEFTELIKALKPVAKSVGYALV